MLIVAGVQVPVMPSIEVVSNAGATDPWQNGPIGLKVTVTSGMIVILNVLFIAHCPGFGVNVYSVVPASAVLTVDGLQVPVIPSSDVEGSAGAILN